MNSKISSGQVMTISVGLISALFPGLANFLIISSSKNASMLSMTIAFILGFIPILMVLTISKKIDNQSLFSFLKTKFSYFGYIINFILSLLAIFIIFISSWLLIDFLISQFLTRTSYYFIAIIFSIIIGFMITKGIEVTSRTIFILFVLVIPLTMLLWICLAPYIEIENLKPFIDVKISGIIKSTFVFIVYASLPTIYILNLKQFTKDKQNFERKILVSYIISFIIAIVFIFLILAIYGIDIANILTYPVYSLFKKVQVFGFIERIENIASIVIIVPFITQYSYLIHFLKESIKETFNIKSKKKINILIYLLSIIIPIISIYLFKKYNLIKLTQISPYIISSLSILIAIIFIRCIFIKKTRSS